MVFFTGLHPYLQQQWARYYTDLAILFHSNTGRRLPPDSLLVVDIFQSIQRSKKLFIFITEVKFLQWDTN